ncbi:LLM class flavin-dependent oxidoreductase, partial [Pseudomonas sp.]|uniref:LLM class flavin-dependent oxidoreductase n=1 Tax=Pseudomonas sp. TaxID=306 RepID=UPI00258BB9CA
TSEDGRDFAASNADAIFVHGENFEQASAYYQDLKRRAAEAGRDPLKLAILPGIRPIVGKDEAEVESRYQQAVDLVSIEDAIVALGRSFDDHDFTRYPLDAPFPDVGHLGANSHKGSSERIVELARERNLTLRETALYFSRPKRDFVGTAEQVADQIEHWFKAGAADGFIVNSVLPDGLQYFTELVVPVLVQRGLFRAEYAGTTLREHLGLDVPDNRYAAPAAARAPAEEALA